MDRRLCLNCRQPAFSCFCSVLSPLDPKIEFVILIHPLEARRRIATGRMTHLMLENSRLLEGHDYSGDARVDEIVNDPARHCVILYPGRLSTDITHFSKDERASLFPNDKRLTVFVIDGTWNSARKTAHLSRNLH
ncbi:MAG: tRNA-uridine aminocarboxypropyltransferase, partial [Bdellovibrionia bacterium]